LPTANSAGIQHWRSDALIWQTHPMSEAKRRRQGALIQGSGGGEQPQVVVASVLALTSACSVVQQPRQELKPAALHA
jgi:hypothetical protein